MAAASAGPAQAVVWKSGTDTLVAETVKVSNVGTFELTGSYLSHPIKLTATGLECLIETCRIEGLGHSSETLRFTTVSTSEPANCTVRGVKDSVGGVITTESLQGQVEMDLADPEGKVTFDKVTPTKSGGAFVTLVFEGLTCVLNEDEVPVKGSVTGRTENTGVQKSAEPITFNSTQQATGGGKLTFGVTNVAQLTGVAVNELSGIFRGEPFGAE